VEVTQLRQSGEQIAPAKVIRPGELPWVAIQHEGNGRQPEIGEIPQAGAVAVAQWRTDPVEERVLLKALQLAIRGGSALEARHLFDDTLRQERQSREELHQTAGGRALSQRVPRPGRVGPAPVG